MPYQSILSSGSGMPASIPSSKSTAYRSISSHYHPGQYAGEKTAPVQLLQPAHILDVKTLQSALKNKQITQQQFIQRFGELKGLKSPPKYSVGNTFSALGNALNSVLVKPVVNTAKAPLNEAALLKNEATHNSKGVTKSTKALSNSSKGSLFAPLAQTAELAGTNLAANKVLNDKHTTPEQKQTILKTVVNPAYNKNDFDLKDKGAKLAGKGALLVGLDALTAAGANKAGDGIINAGKQAVESAKVPLGKDAAVNTLINGQKTARAVSKANLASKLGGSTVKEANTTRIPVLEPTQSAAARTKLGSTAIAEADKTRIPVSGKSTSVTGKVSTIDGNTYLKKSNQLSKQYEKELARIQSVPHPVTQQVLQRQLDLKYSRAQEQLDASAGKTSIGFTGKATATKLPTSALDDGKPVKPPTATTKSAPTPSTKATTTTKTPATPSATTKIPVVSKPKSGSMAEPTTTADLPKTPAATGEAKVAGSANRTETEAILKGMQGEFDNKATFNGLSHKENAQRAAQLVKEDPKKAMEVAMGRRAGENSSHESAVYHAVKNDALKTAQKTGDYSVVQQLASSPRHAAVSEAAQKLGAEGYHLDPHDPIQILAKLSKTRAEALGKKTGATVEKTAAKIGEQVKAARPQVTRQDWHSFVKELQCK